MGHEYFDALPFRYLVRCECFISPSGQVLSSLSGRGRGSSRVDAQSGASSDGDLDGGERRCRGQILLTLQTLPDALVCCFTTIVWPSLSSPSIHIRQRVPENQDAIGPRGDLLVGVRAQ